MPRTISPGPLYPPGPCGCLGPQGGDPLCPCAMIMLEIDAKRAIATALRERAAFLRGYELAKQELLKNGQ